MKKGWKIFAVVCAAIGGVGILLCIAGFAIGVTDKDVRAAFNRGIGLHRYKTHTEMEVTRIDRDDDEIMYEEEPEPAYENEFVYDGIRNIDVEVGRMEVYVTVTDNEEQVRVEHDAHEKLHFRSYQEGDTLKIETKHEKTRIRHGGTVHIYIPKDIALRNAEFSIGAGVLRVDGVTADEIDIECGAGEVEFTADGQETDYNYEVEIGAGEVTIGGETFGGLAVEKTINNHAHREMTIECGAGRVTVAFEQQ